MKALTECLPHELVELISGLLLPEARKLLGAAFRGQSILAPIVGIRRVALNQVRKQLHVPRLSQALLQHSSIDTFVKIAFNSGAGSLFETVRIPLEKPGRFSVCVSSQVGCALACTFCATGKLGLLRNLETWEILEQVREIRDGLPTGGRVHGVVFQGMGEPLANFERVAQAVRILSEPCALAVDARNITVTTAGLPTGIRKLAAELPRVRLGWSLGSAREDVRKQLMPITATHSLEDVFAAVVYHAQVTDLAPLWALAPLAGVNDTLQDARALGALLTRFTDQVGRRPRVTLVPYNALGPSDPYRRQTDEEEARFREQLQQFGVFSHKRYSGGGDVAAACGQLVAGQAAGSLVTLRKKGVTELAS